MALARQLLDLYDRSPMPDRLEFFQPARRAASTRTRRQHPSRLGGATSRTPRRAHLAGSPRSGRAAAAGAVPPPQPRPRRHGRPGGDARGPDQARRQGRRSCARSTTTSRTCSAPGSTAASWSCAGSTGRRRPTSWRRSSATRPCTRSRAGTTCAAASSRRPALLRLLPSLAGRRAADFRRGGADPRDPGLDPVAAGRGARRCCRPRRRRRRCSTRSRTASRACAASRSAIS